MAGSAQSAKDSKMAGDLVKRGIYHGRRMTKPHANSSGNTLTAGPGSSKFQRLIERARGN